MELLQLREKEIFEALKLIKKCRFAVIGGYAVNAYALPRFSVDCDIVVQDKREAQKISEALETAGYSKEAAGNNSPNKGAFIRYAKDAGHGFKASIDIMAENIHDRQTKADFSAEWVFQNSSVIKLRGKTISEALNLRIINLDALIAMKIVSCRTSDIRDVFMLMPKAADTNWIKAEVSKRCGFGNRISRVQAAITPDNFKNNLQGVYGRVDESVFEKHKKAVLELGRA